ncbi:MAG: phosphate acyltransferase PlsX [Desulfuromonadales bacterium]|nr:phosphate acyltransferase PlsX [Desulfuromonadales bacterium]MDH3960164.1 phosphate acyltransferase PlsX [Desulfuromonadales bacterium]MDH4026427.1 phosphate acyltransferase PlsX [Desulfuromonadales bacterium]
MSNRPVVAVDAMGGDNSPRYEVDGAVKAARRWQIPVVLVGQSEIVAEELSKHDTQGLDIRIEHASEVVGMQDSASDAVRKKKDSSIRVSFNMLKEGRANAVVSTGNSGATMAAGMFVLKRIPGIDRPAIATLVPNLEDQTLVLDVGGNVDCKPPHLVQFALMGSVYVAQMLGKATPRIGLLSNGSEESKGNELTREANQILKRTSLNYVGYTEGRDIYNANVDVVVCDGFVGNVVLKVSEGLAEAIGAILREEFSSRFLSKLGYLLARPALKAFKKKVDYAEYGGAPLLGVQGTAMICHGSSNPQAIMNAIKMAHDSETHQVISKMSERLEELQIEN